MYCEKNSVNVYQTVTLWILYSRDVRCVKKTETAMKYKHLKTYEKILLKQLPVVILGYVLI